MQNSLYKWFFMIAATAVTTGLIFGAMILMLPGANEFVVEPSERVKHALPIPDYCGRAEYVYQTIVNELPSMTACAVNDDCRTAIQPIGCKVAINEASFTRFTELSTAMKTNKAKSDNSCDIPTARCRRTNTIGCIDSVCKLSYEP
jgi:hypothetical protein